MARPKENELTQRELEVMHVFWEHGELTASDVRERLEAQGLKRAYPTVANLVRGLAEKSLLDQTNESRPFTYRPAKSYQDVSHRLLNDLMQRAFFGSREKLLVGLLSEKRLTAKERAVLEKLLKESK